MTPEQEQVIAKAVPLIKEFVTQPSVLAQLSSEGKKVVYEEIDRFENDLRFRIEERKLREKQEALVAKVQAECLHVAGANPIGEGVYDIAGRSSIVWHRMNPKPGNGSLDVQDIGICTICQRKFLPEDEDYKVWRKKPSFNRLSESGVPVVVWEEDGKIVYGLPEDNFKYISEKEAFYGKDEPQTEEDFLQLSFEELDKRSDFEIRKIMEYVRKERKKSKKKVSK